MAEFILGIAVGLVSGITIEAFVFKPTDADTFGDRIMIVLGSLLCIAAAGAILLIAFALTRKLT